MARALVSLPRFARDWVRFSRLVKPLGVKMHFRPALHDRRDSAGVMDEYFWQDLVVAQMIHAAAPERHVDVGSMLNGFVAHVASFRPIEVIDIRPITHSIPGVTFTQLDLMQGGRVRTPSLSCLHTIEHFGLGRYGDPLTVDGPSVGIARLSEMLEPQGVLYLSTPIGKERVEFNANWVSDPERILATAGAVGLRLERLMYVENGYLSQSFNAPADVKRLSSVEYALGIFVFRMVPELR